MGKDLCVAIKFFDRTTNKWLVLSSRVLHKNKVVIFDKNKYQQRIFDKLRTEDVDEEDIEGEAIGEMHMYFTMSIDRNYALFDYIASAGDRDGSVKQLSGFRGYPLDKPSNVDYEYYFGSSSASFLSVAELQNIDWDSRIDIVREITVAQYTDKELRANIRANRMVVSQEDFVAADKEATKEMLKRDLYIKIDTPRYIDKNNDFVVFSKDLVDFTRRHDISPHDVRVILIFTY